MSTIYPEKVAVYFSSMNPLSAKIFADVKSVEETLKFDENLSFSEKSKIIDKHLIYDVIRRNKKKQKGEDRGPGIIPEEDEEEIMSEDQILYEDPELDKDHVTALLAAVYPKKPEKYIYDDNNFYLDEHSEPFSYCSQSQTTFCDLEKLVKNLPAPSLPLTRKLDSKARVSGSSHREKKQAPSLPIKRLSEELCSDVFSSTESVNSPATNQKAPVKKSGYPALGVPVIGFGAASTSESTYALSKPDSSGKMNPPVDEANLPKQVQNSDLIAELQQKLKMNKGKGTTLKQTPSTKVNKPKAPPPPPPKQSPGMAVKVKNESQSQMEESKEKGKSENSPISNNRSPKPDTKLEYEPKKSEDDFSVDVSSPCRIATPKTGFDFLDNW